MAVESKRGCGYRKVGGLYLVGGSLMEPCDRLPMPLIVCPCCGEGVKPARGWTWINPFRFFGGKHINIKKDRLYTLECKCSPSCTVCNPPDAQHGLIWVGERHYPTPKDFGQEAMKQGISRRIKSLPKDFKLGETWVYFAHRKAIENIGEPFDNGPAYTPGVFSAFLPKRLERIVKQSEFDLWDYARSNWKEELLRDNKDIPFTKWVDNNYISSVKDNETLKKLFRDYRRGITFVPVPDDDKDHQ